MEIINILKPKKKLQGGTLSISSILDIIDKNKNEWKEAFKKYHSLSKKDIINYLNTSLVGSGKKKEIEEGEEDLTKERDISKGKKIDEYTIINITKFLASDKGKYYQGKKKNEMGELVNKKLFEYDPFETAFEKNYDKYRDYQKNIIETWSISAQELLILYYGVGTGKTIIATTCGEEFSRLNPEANIYFLLPASLVFNTIGLMFHYGIDPLIKKNGEYIYNFISYQQMIRTKFDFKDNSLLIIDEIHNLRNLTSEYVKIRRGTKWQATSQIKLYGNVLSKYLLENSHKVIRKIFMTGTLFVNGPQDIESIISIGYNKPPLLNIDDVQYDNINNNPTLFKNYYQGLIAFYRIEGENLKLMPTVKYNFVSITTKDDASLLPPPQEDPFLINTRTFGSKEKIIWIINFLLEKKEDKTLIYVQFLDKQIIPLKEELDKKKLKYGIISGELSAPEKQKIIDEYNTDKLKLIIFSLAIKEGISFKETNNFIVFTPYWNYAITEQVIARAIRLDSHKLGSTSKVDVYFPLMNSIKNDPNSIYNINKFIEKSNYIFNTINIKNFIFNDKKIEKYFDIKFDPMKQRDIDMYMRMFSKMSMINNFEKKILELPSFQEVNNIENNDFIKEFNTEILDLESKGKKLTKKQKIELKQKLYKNFYKKKIQETNKKIERYSGDIGIRNQEEKEFLKVYPDKSNEIREAIKANKDLAYLFSLFNLTKEDIQLLNAFFTPINHAERLIELSGIDEDKRNDIKVLEPTAGIGNLIGQLLKTSVSENLLIDCIEINNIFYQIGTVLYEYIDNVKWLNLNFIDYFSRYNYDYIFMNPPFNIKTYINNNIETVYDIQFVAKAYNLLNEKGILCAIISSRFIYDKSPKFKDFNDSLDYIRSIDNTYVYTEKLETGFKKDKTIVKEMATNVSMYFIRLKKIQDYNINTNFSKIKKKKEEEIEKELEEPISNIILEPIPQPIIETNKKSTKRVIDVKDKKKVKNDLLTLIEKSYKLVDDYKKGNITYVEEYIRNLNKMEDLKLYYSQIQNKENEGVNKKIYDNSLILKISNLNDELRKIIRELQPPTKYIPPPPPPPKIIYNIDPKEKSTYRLLVENDIKFLKSLNKELDNKYLDKNNQVNIINKKKDTLLEHLNKFDQIKYNNKELKYKTNDDLLIMRANLILDGINNKLKKLGYISNPIPQFIPESIPEPIPEPISIPAPIPEPIPEPISIPAPIPKLIPKPKQIKEIKGCPDDKILNPATGRCVNKDGPIGKKLLKGSGINKSSYIIQSILFKKPKYNIPKTILYLSKNNKKNNKIDETDNFLRARQVEPSKLKGYNYKTIKKGKDIEEIIAYK